MPGLQHVLQQFSKWFARVYFLSCNFKVSKTPESNGGFRANSSAEFVAQLQCEYVSCLRFVSVLAAWFIHTQHVQVALLIALSPLQNSCQ